MQLCVDQITVERQSKAKPKLRRPIRAFWLKWILPKQYVENTQHGSRPPTGIFAFALRTNGRFNSASCASPCTMPHRDWLGPSRVVNPREYTNFSTKSLLVGTSSSSDQSITTL